MEKIKDFITSKKGKDFTVVLIIILLGLGSFGLGRMSKNPAKSGINIEYLQEPAQLQPASAITTQIEPENANLGQNEPQNEIRVSNNSNTVKAYFASSRGRKYYHLGCTGGKTLKEQNIIWFSSEEEARGAGYELSTSCR